MADDIQVSQGSGTYIATDQESGGNAAHMQIVKLAYSADGSKTLLQADANGLLVAISPLTADGTALTLSAVTVTTVSEKITSLNYRELTLYWDITAITGTWRLMLRVYDPDDNQFFIVLNSADKTAIGTTRIQYPIFDNKFDIRLLNVAAGAITCTVRYLLKS